MVLLRRGVDDESREVSDGSSLGCLPSSTLLQMLCKNSCELQVKATQLGFKPSSPNAESPIFLTSTARLCQAWCSVVSWFTAFCAADAFGELLMHPGRILLELQLLCVHGGVGAWAPCPFNLRPPSEDRLYPPLALSDEDPCRLQVLRASRPEMKLP